MGRETISFSKQEIGHDQAAEPAVAIEKRVQNRELPMDDRQMPERVRRSR